MNIIAINPVKNVPLSIQKENCAFNTHFGLKMASPLAKDTVSFRAITIKKQPKCAKAISKQLSTQIEAIGQKRQAIINRFVDNLFGDLCVTEYSPSNIIYKICKRSKSANSIREKCTTRAQKESGWDSRDGILQKMTDLNGVKLVLRDGSRKGTNIALERILEAVQKKQLIVREIENKRPIVSMGKKGFEAEKYDYASVDYMKNFAKKVNVKYNHLEPDYTKMNYPAIHMLLEIPKTNFVFELQIMGKDVALYKDLDDILFKILNNKEVDKKYKPIIDRIKPLNEPGNADLKERFNMYRGNVFIFQREKAPHIGTKRTEYFLPPKNEFAGYDVDDKFDMNELYRLMQECDKKAGNKVKK